MSGVSEDGAKEAGWGRIVGAGIYEEGNVSEGVMGEEGNGDLLLLILAWRSEKENSIYSPREVHLEGEAQARVWGLDGGLVKWGFGEGSKGTVQHLDGFVISSSSAPIVSFISSNGSFVIHSTVRNVC